MLAFRKSTLADIDRMMEVVTGAQELLRSQGIDQWQKGYPNRELLISDVHEGIGYVVTEDDRVVAMCAVTFTDEESYHTIEGGQWLTPNDSVYATVHRGAVARDSQGKGLTTFLFQSVADLTRAAGVKSLRADTHPDNPGMNRSLQKAGFVRCGMITLVGGSEDGDPRVAYELMV